MVNKLTLTVTSRTTEVQFNKIKHANQNKSIQLDCQISTPLWLSLYQLKENSDVSDILWEHDGPKKLQMCNYGRNPNKRV